MEKRSITQYDLQENAAKDMISKTLVGSAALSIQHRIIHGRLPQNQG
jgi:hypothetical protein